MGVEVRDRKSKDGGRPQNWMEKTCIEESRRKQRTLNDTMVSSRDSQAWSVIR